MGVNPTITFVSAFLDLLEDRSKDKSFDKCFSLFKTLAQSGINICLFVSQVFYERALDISKEYPNIYLMPSIELEELWTYQVTKCIPNIGLPEQKLSHHDTSNFLTLMNSKIEFVSKAIKLNPFNTEHFAWIDFSICHVIKNPNNLKRLYTFSRSALRDKMFVFPACLSKIELERKYTNIYSSVIWRFCGGFFIGDRESLIEFNNCYRRYYPLFLQETQRLVWEINFWVWLERNNYIYPETYLANHNDSIIEIPSRYLKTVACFTTIPPRFYRCKATIRALLHQVDHIYISISSYYERFGSVVLPDFSIEDEFKGKVTVVESNDYGPATKYLGALSKISDTQWIVFCDDDQIYKGNVVDKMKESIFELGAYQNNYHSVKNGSGGIIHGFVGNMFHRSLLNNLSSFELPACSRFVDDQWMSIYCFLNKISIYPTNINSFSDLLAVLSNGHELIGEASLAGLGNRDEKVLALANHFNVVFKSEGKIEYK